MFNLNAFVNHFWYGFNYIYGVIFGFGFTRSLLYLIGLSYALLCTLNQKPFLRAQLL
ncbi:hypothetical protein HMPREF1427_01307 [Helicobacter pylori GAM83Bi]|nr:hypothetical protein HMPREF1427_01307 [Helicobacter pylori GAM83Bi]EMH38580.1 hypothetical protein HMPREF1428_01113 [Helicobacter pylori GAM83T]